MKFKEMIYVCMHVCVHARAPWLSYIMEHCIIQLLCVSICINQKHINITSKKMRET